MFVICSVLFAAVAMTSHQVNGEENQWFVKATKAQHSIDDSISNIKSYKASEDSIKSTADKAFDDFVKFVKNEIAPLLEKLSGTSELDVAYKTRISILTDSLDRINNGSDNSTNEARGSLEKFEYTVQKMVERSQTFAERLRTVPPEQRGFLTECGVRMSKCIDKLVNNMKEVESQLKNAEVRSNRDEKTKEISQ